MPGYLAFLILNLQLICGPQDRFNPQSLRGGIVAMTGYNVPQDEDLGREILEIIAEYQAISITDIWYELGEDDRFRGGIPLAEVGEALSLLEGQEMIIKVENDKWTIKSLPK